MLYKLNFSERAKADLRYFERNDGKCYKKAWALLHELMDHPYTGTGKPERLRYDLSGCWSRRIDSEHRLVYSVRDEVVEVYVLTMRYHYGK